MRIHHVITRLIIGGAQENTVSTVLGLRSREGLEVRLLTGPTEGAEGSLEGVFQDYPECLVKVPDLVRPVHPYRDFRAFRQLTHYFRMEHPDVVHTHSGKAGVLGRLAARKARVPLVIHSIHGPSFGPFQGALANAIFSSAERWAGRATDHFVVVADAMRDQYLAAGIGRPEQYTRIYSGFDLAPFLNARPDPVTSARMGIQRGDFVIGMIARLFALKGHEDLISAAPEIIRRIPQARFLLVGDGSWRHRLESRVRAEGLSARFLFAGLVPPREVAGWVGQMSCLIHLSRREGLPRALPQALAAGKPVVAYDCDGASEVCRPHVTGFLIPPGDLGALVEALASIAGNPELARRLGETGRAWVSQRFTTTKLVQDQFELYHRLSRKTASSPPRFA